MKQKISFILFKIIRAAIKFFYPKISVEGTENLPKEPVLVVGNHTQMNGPICCEIYFPGNSCTWCASQMMNFKEVPAYAYSDFWSQKPKRSRWFYKILAYLITPFSVCIFNNAKTLPVYRDQRVLSTFRNTVNKLSSGANVIVFPEYDKKYNNIIYDFQDRFIDVARLYYKKTGKELGFVPMYIAPKLKKMYLGKPIYFNHEKPMDDERKRICEYLMSEITKIACSLPKHRVVPYRNIPKKDYPYNIVSEVPDSENSRG